MGAVCCYMLHPLGPIAGVQALEVENEGPKQEQSESAGEMNGVSKVYETMDFFLYQTFFDHLSSEFIPPLLGNLTYFSVKDINGTLDLLD